MDATMIAAEVTLDVPAASVFDFPPRVVNVPITNKGWMDMLFGGMEVRLHSDHEAALLRTLFKDVSSLLVIKGNRAWLNVQTADEESDDDAIPAETIIDDRRAA